MAEPVSMNFKDDVYCRVLSNDEKLSTSYYVNVLCGSVDETVDVYSFGIAGGANQEFTFHFDGGGLLGQALSATNGWGHANAKCFTPN